MSVSRELRLLARTQEGPDPEWRKEYLGWESADRRRTAAFPPRAAAGSGVSGLCGPEEAAGTGPNNPAGRCAAQRPASSPPQRRPARRDSQTQGIRPAPQRRPVPIRPPRRQRGPGFSQHSGTPLFADFLYCSMASGWAEFFYPGAGRFPVPQGMFQGSLDLFTVFLYHGP